MFSFLFGNDSTQRAPEPARGVAEHVTSLATSAFSSIAEMLPDQDDEPQAPPAPESAVASISSKRSGATEEIQATSSNQLESPPPPLPAEIQTGVRNGEVVLNSSHADAIPPAVTAHMQSLLVDIEYLDAEHATGRYDERTAAAVRELQEDLGINQDGIMGLFTTNLALVAGGQDTGMTQEEFREFILRPENARFIRPGLGKDTITAEEVAELYARAEAIRERLNRVEPSEQEAQPENEPTSSEFSASQLQALTSEIIQDGPGSRQQNIRFGEVRGTPEQLEQLDLMLAYANLRQVTLVPQNVGDTDGRYRVDVQQSVYDGSHEWYLTNWGWSPLIGAKSPEQLTREAHDFMLENAAQFGYAAVVTGGQLELFYVGQDRAWEIALARKRQEAEG